MSPKARFLKLQYQMEKVTKDDLRNAVVNEKITPEEYEWITGEPYEVTE